MTQQIINGVEVQWAGESTIINGLPYSGDQRGSDLLELVEVARRQMLHGKIAGIALIEGVAYYIYEDDTILEAPAACASRIQQGFPRPAARYRIMIELVSGPSTIATFGKSREAAERFLETMKNVLPDLKLVDVQV